MIVEREKEIESFKSVSSFKVSAVFKNEYDKIFKKTEIPKRYDKKEVAEEFLNKCISADFRISDIEKKPQKNLLLHPLQLQHYNKKAQEN